MTDSDLSCRQEERREAVRATSAFGLDYAEVSDDQRTIYVYFLGKAPQNIEMANIRLRGGRRIRDVQVTNLLVHRQTDPALDDFMEVTVNKPGDFSVYCLSVVQLDDAGNPTNQPFAGFDPRYDDVRFSFKASCPTGLDCKSEHVCPPPDRVNPEINYLAKDYASFRQLILDRLALTMPQWQETHVPDLGIALVEVLAYVGDYLSYYQDAVATEAYIGTARQRISVRRHARLVDYQMHEGCNARAWVTIQTDTDLSFDPTQIYFITEYPGVPARNILTPNDLTGVPSTAYEVFQPLLPDAGTLQIHAAHSEIHLYTWGDCQCCLAKGATSATLIDQWVTPPAPTEPPPSQPPPSQPVPAAPRIATAGTHAHATTGGPQRALNLQPGDILIFEEVIGPKTGNPADANPTHRQAVRLTRVTPGVDSLFDTSGNPAGQPIVEIEWALEDALTFTLCISTQNPPPKCDCLENVTIVRGNVVLVDNGGDTSETLGTVPTLSTTQRCATACTPAETTYLAALFRPALSQTPLTFSQPLPACASAKSLLLQDPRQGLPDITLSSVPPAPACPPHPDPAPPCQLTPLFTFDDLADPSGLARLLKNANDPGGEYLLAQLSVATQQALAAYDPTTPLPDALRADLIADLTALLDTWLPERDLLESGPDERGFVAEMDDGGDAHLRFGDSNLGRQPDAGTTFRARYRTGNGTAGNVGAEVIRYLVLRQEKLGGVTLTIRNPMPASGGTDPEPVSEVKLLAPYAFRDVLERAVTAADYAALAGNNSRRLAERGQLIAQRRDTAAICNAPFQGLQNAKATLRWNGSWYTALVALDPLGREYDTPDLLQEVTDYLEPYRRVGHDLLVAGAAYVPLDLSLIVCVSQGYLRGHVESALLDVFSGRVLANGKKGFFHPDNLTFGQGVYISAIVAAAQAVAGVQNVTVSRLQRWDLVEGPLGSPGALPKGGILTLGPLEIARLDNDANFPENGRLSLDMRGGR